MAHQIDYISQRLQKSGITVKTRMIPSERGIAVQLEREREHKDHESCGRDRRSSTCRIMQSPAGGQPDYTLISIGEAYKTAHTTRDRETLKLLLRCLLTSTSCSYSIDYHFKKETHGAKALQRFYLRSAMIQTNLVRNREKTFPEYLTFAIELRNCK